jgi:hypothetical protein
MLTFENFYALGSHWFQIATFINDPRRHCKLFMIFSLIVGVYSQGKCFMSNRSLTTSAAVSKPTTVALPSAIPAIAPTQPSIPPKQPLPVPTQRPVVPVPKQPSSEPIQQSQQGGFRPRAFNTPQVGIGSWFRANHKSDDTNGNSWCGYPYKDHTPGFAPDLAQMTQNTLAVWRHPRWEEFGKEYCGLEAIVRNPETGVQMTLYITDAFDPKWVRNRGAIDIMVNPYLQLTGNAPLDKNKVIRNVEWRLTGNRNPKYAFKGPGDR